MSYTNERIWESEACGDAEHDAAAAILMLTGQQLGPSNKAVSKQRAKTARCSDSGRSAADLNGQATSDSGTNNTQSCCENQTGLASGVRFMLTQQKGDVSHQAIQEGLTFDTRKTEKQPHVNSEPMVNHQGIYAKRSQQGSTGGGPPAKRRTQTGSGQRTANKALPATIASDTNVYGVKAALQKTPAASVKDFLIQAQARSSRTGDSTGKAQEQSNAQSQQVSSRKRARGSKKVKSIELSTSAGLHSQSSDAVATGQVPALQAPVFNMAHLLGVRSFGMPMPSHLLAGPLPTLESLGISLPPQGSGKEAHVVRGRDGQKYLLTPLPQC